MKIEKTKRERSVAYPSFQLGEAIESSSKLRLALGKGPYSRDEAAVALGYKGVSGISATKISTMVHFGLLTRNGNTYSQSELAERINHPVSDEDRLAAINEAVQTPKLYKDLLAQFGGQALPTQLGNILIRKGISARISDSVAENFRGSLEFSGSLKNGVVLTVLEPIEQKMNVREESRNEKDTFFPPITEPVIGDTKKIHAYHESGSDWVLAVRSVRPITSDVKKKLIEIAELLEDKDVQGSKIL